MEHLRNEESQIPRQARNDRNKSHPELIEGSHKFE